MKLMNKKTETFDYIEANSELFRLDLVCKIIDVNGNLNSTIAKTNSKNITYIQTIKDFSIYLEGVAYNIMNDFKINMILNFEKESSIRKKQLMQYDELCYKVSEKRTHLPIIN